MNDGEDETRDDEERVKESEEGVRTVQVSGKNTTALTGKKASAQRPTSSWARRHHIT
jgi:hypothetical protein